MKHKRTQFLTLLLVLCLMATGCGADRTEDSSGAVAASADPVLEPTSRPVSRPSPTPVAATEESPLPTGHYREVSDPCTLIDPSPLPPDLYEPGEATVVVSLSEKFQLGTVMHCTLQLSGEHQSVEIDGSLAFTFSLYTDASGARSDFPRLQVPEIAVQEELEQALEDFPEKTTPEGVGTRARGYYDNTRLEDIRDGGTSRAYVVVVQDQNLLARVYMQWERREGQPFATSDAEFRKLLEAFVNEVLADFRS